MVRRANIATSEKTQNGNEVFQDGEEGKMVRSSEFRWKNNIASKSPLRVFIAMLILKIRTTLRRAREKKEKDCEKNRHGATLLDSIRVAVLS